MLLTALGTVSLAVHYITYYCIAALWSYYCITALLHYITTLLHFGTVELTVEITLLLRLILRHYLLLRRCGTMELTFENFYQGNLHLAKEGVILEDSPQVSLLSPYLSF